MRYFAKARPKELRTASELARFRTLANGPVSRIVRALAQKGLLRKAAVRPKGRSELLELTEEGEALMARDPSQALREAIAGLPDAEREALAPTFEAVLCRFSTETPGP